jgi:hypothetical protein
MRCCWVSTSAREPAMLPFMSTTALPTPTPYWRVVRSPNGNCVGPQAFHWFDEDTLPEQRRVNEDRFDTEAAAVAAIDRAHNMTEWPQPSEHYASGGEDCPLYWRILRRPGQALHVVCMQNFDEYDYDQDRFVTEHRYPSEEEATQTVAAAYSAIA